MAISRRIFTREFKLSAIEQIESGRSLARVARELEVHENVLRRWKQEIQKNPSQAFSGNGNRVSSREAELERKIGQMTLEIDFLKKALQRVEEQRLLEKAGGGARSTRKSKKK